MKIAPDNTSMDIQEVTQIAEQVRSLSTDGRFQEIRTESRDRPALPAGGLQEVRTHKRRTEVSR